MCKWKYDQEGCFYYTACSQSFFFDSGTFKENSFIFCPFCGKKIESEMAYTEEMLDHMRAIDRAMRVSVSIPREEADRLVVSTLIGVRNSPVNATQDTSHFDAVLRHYLTDKEFQKYVIERCELE